MTPNGSGQDPRHLLELEIDGLQVLFVSFALGALAGAALTALVVLSLTR